MNYSDRWKIVNKEMDEMENAEVSKVLHGLAEAQTAGKKGVTTVSAVYY